MVARLAAGSWVKGERELLNVVGDLLEEGLTVKRPHDDFHNVCQSFDAV